MQKFLELIKLCIGPQHPIQGLIFIITMQIYHVATFTGITYRQTKHLLARNNIFLHRKEEQCAAI
jgi:hypothetical protein